ncbi:MAG: MarR family winged helix-turn-helix transcriptional regulator [Pseudomonadales bacterium]
MNQPAESLPGDARAQAQQEALWARYRSNLPRHIMGLSRHGQAELMQALTEQLGHEQLRLSFEPFISLIGDDGLRLTELAAGLGISKQAANQTANQIESAGYIMRTPDPADGRARILRLTSAGKALIQQGVDFIGSVEQQYVELIGTKRVKKFSKLLLTLSTGLGLPQARLPRSIVASPVLLGGMLPRISDYMANRLMQLTIEKGHADLKMSFGQVLTLIGLSGGRIQQMARIQSVSKQAISAIATELEQLGYIQRLPDPADSRQVLLIFTEQGLQLLTDSVASLDELEQDIVPIMGHEGLQDLQNIAAELYASLQLEDEVFTSANVSVEQNLPELAVKLKKQLGTQGALQLAQLLKN